jgi:hypothetical protein
MSAPFIGSEFFLESVAQYALATVRVRFTQDPLASNPTAPNDGLNPANYTVSGPAANAVVSVGPVFGDPQAVDVFLQQPLAPGTWTLTVASNVQMWDLTSILTPRIMSFTASALTQPEAVSGGALDDTAADILRKHLNTALTGKGWDSIIEAMATGDTANRTLAESAFDQLFKTSAGGLYLDRKSGDDGLVRPSTLGMPDDLFREYSIRATTGKLVENAILDILEVFYGSDSVRAHADSVMSEPYLFQDGDDLQVLVNERDAVTITFTDADFAVPGTARAAEVAAAITRAFRVNGLSAYAIAVTDPTTGLTGVRILSGALGLASSVRITGGKAQYALRFPTYLSVFSGLPTWTLTYAAVSSTLRLQPNGSVDLSQLRVGDYMTLYGTEFNAGNRGTYVITNVFYAYSPGLVQYIEVVNTTGVAQVVVQGSATSLNFFRPTKQTAYTDATRAVIVACPGDGLDVILPATSQAVGRAPKQAAYAQGQTSKAVTSIKRLGTTVTVSCTGHGLSVGDWFQLDDVKSTYALPATIAGSGNNLSARLVSIISNTAAVPVNRYAHAAVKLADGRVFSIGGIDAVTGLSTTTGELATITGPTVLGGGERRWTIAMAAATAYPGTAPANAPASLLIDPLRNGQVLVTGGEKEDQTASYNATYLYTPNGGAGTWAAGPNMSSRRSRHKQITLDNGKVLIVGGTDNNVSATTSLSSCDLYNPATNTIAATGSLNNTVRNPTLVKLADGKILCIGGRGRVGGTLPNENLWTCEIYDPGTGLWTNTGSMAYGRIQAAAALLPDGRVLVGGGLGQEVSDSVASAGDSLDTCEIWSPVTGRWSAGPRMNEKRNIPQFFVIGTKVYAFGDGSDPVSAGGLNDTAEYLDINEMVWRRSPATATGRNFSRMVAVNSELILITGGVAYDGTFPLFEQALVIASETIGASLNKQFKVATVVDANTFTFTTDDSGYFNAAAGATMTRVAAGAALAGSPGPFTYDPLDGPGITGSASAITTQLNKGHQYASVDVADATQFPDQSGWLVFGYGYSYQVGPVRYLGRLSSTRIALDYNFKFTATVPVGASATLLVQKGPWVPDAPEQVGSFYATGSAAGRVAAEAAVDAAVAAGVTVRKQVTYPGDRGLGGEGLPASGVAKLSDKVAVWAGDEVDTEVETARED